jgi:hypothetical protein
MATKKLVRQRGAAARGAVQAASRQQLEAAVLRLALELYGPELDPDSDVNGGDAVDAGLELLVSVGVYAAVTEVGRERS